MRVSRATPTDFLLPFLRLPAERLCLGFTTEDGAVAYSEDLNARQLTINGSPTFGTTSQGIPYAVLNGSSDFFSVADATWNSPTGPLTVFTVHKPASAATTAQAVAAKWQLGGDFSWKIGVNTQMRADISGDGTTDTARTNTAPAASWQVTAFQFEPSANLHIWNSLAGTMLSTLSTGIPASLYNSVAPLDIGCIRTSGGAASNLYAGNIALVAISAALLDLTYVATLISHCKRFGVA